MGQSAITGVNLGVPAYQRNFVDGDLVAGVLTINHNLNSQYCSVTVYNNNDLIIIPDDVDAVSTTQCTVDLTSYGTLTGTWRAIILDKGATNSFDPTATNLNLAGQATGDYAVYNGSAWTAQPSKSQHGFIQRDLSVASGNQVVTGVGFEPTSIHFIMEQAGGIADPERHSIGFSDGNGGDGCLFYQIAGVSGWSSTSANCIYWVGSSQGYVATCTFQSDGFTIAWTRNGSPTGLININWFATR